MTTYLLVILLCRKLVRHMSSSSRLERNEASREVEGILKSINSSCQFFILRVLCYLFFSLFVS